MSIGLEVHGVSDVINKTSCGITGKYGNSFHCIMLRVKNEAMGRSCDSDTPFDAQRLE
jgi:hypothetical protein